jgi:hypothetical protein
MTCDVVIYGSLSLRVPFRGVFFLVLFLVGGAFVLFIDLLFGFDSCLAALDRFFAGCAGVVLVFVFLLFHPLGTEIFMPQPVLLGEMGAGEVAMRWRFRVINRLVLSAWRP